MSTDTSSSTDAAAQNAQQEYEALQAERDQLLDLKHKLEHIDGGTETASYRRTIDRFNEVEEEIHKMEEALTCL